MANGLIKMGTMTPIPTQITIFWFIFALVTVTNYCVTQHSCNLEYNVQNMDIYLHHCMALHGNIMKIRPFVDLIISIC